MQKALIITGMHRSGTSMIADYLQQCGVDIGSTLYPPDVGNPRGYYEDVEFLEFHQDLLAFLGLSTFPTCDVDLARPIPEKFKIRARDLLRKKRRAPVWGWKDCRTSLFLEFWHEMMPDVKVLFLLRHPVSVVDSLLRRGTDRAISRHPAIAFESWRLHNHRITRFYSQYTSDCFLVDTGDFLRDPRTATAQLFSKLQIELPVQDFGGAFVVGAYKQRRSCRDVCLMLRYPLQTLLCLQLYHRMKQQTDWP